MRFKDKVAVVTGGGRDIGRAVSIRLAAEGARVVVAWANDQASAEATLTTIEEAGGRAVLHRADLTKQAEADGLIAAALAAFGPRIDVLVNLTGGMVQRRPLAEIDEAFFDEVMNLNLKSAYLTTRAAVPHMSAGGAIVNFSSPAGRDGGGPGASIYATSKGAIMTFTRAMAKELGPQGIRVNALCPGMISTKFHDTFTRDEVRKSVAGSTPLRREGRPDEVAAAVAFLVSEEAAFITGANLDINGGLAFS